MFDRLWRGAAGARDRRSGLCLAIVRPITESHGGNVAVFSTPGAGSTFVVWLPARNFADDPVARDAPPVARLRR